MQEYIIQPGDTFYRLAGRIGCSCQDLMRLNPTLNPHALQIGQKIVLPDVQGVQGQFFAEIGHQSGHEFLGQSFDDVEVDIEGIKFRVKRVGEHRVPREVHLIIPRTEIHKIECTPQGNSELRLMVSNINIVNSPYHPSERAACHKNGLTDIAENTRDFADPSANATRQDLSDEWQNYPQLGGQDNYQSSANDNFPDGRTNGFWTGVRRWLMMYSRTTNATVSLGFGPALGVGSCLKDFLNRGCSNIPYFSEK